MLSTLLSASGAFASIQMNQNCIFDVSGGSFIQSLDFRPPNGMDVQLTRLRRPKGVLSSDAADFDEVCQLMRAALSRVPLSFLERHLEEKNVTTILLRAPQASGGVPGASGSTSGNYSNVELRGLQPADVIIDDEHDEVRPSNCFYCVTF